jgi:hypothetical protein
MSHLRRRHHRPARLLPHQQAATPAGSASAPAYALQSAGAAPHTVARWLAAALGHFTELRDAAAQRGPCRALADGLAGRAGALAQMGRHAEAAEDDRRALAMAREIAYPLGR